MKITKLVHLNKSYIEDNLTAVQQSSYTRLLTYEDIAAGAIIAEKMLDHLLPKQKRQNVKCLIRPFYEPFKPEYPYGAKHTECVIKRGRKDWFVENIYRVNVIRAGANKVEIIRESLEKKHFDIINYVTKSLTANG